MYCFVLLIKCISPPLALLTEYLFIVAYMLYFYCNNNISAENLIIKVQNNTVKWYNGYSASAMFFSLFWLLAVALVFLFSLASFLFCGLCQHPWEYPQGPSWPPPWLFKVWKVISVVSLIRALVYYMTSWRWLIRILVNPPYCFIPEHRVVLVNDKWLHTNF